MSGAAQPPSKWRRLVAFLNKDFSLPKRVPQTGPKISRPAAWAVLTLMVIFGVSLCLAGRYVSSLSGRIGVIAGPSAFWLMFLIRFWKSRPVRWGLIALLAVIASYVSWPGGSLASPRVLRALNSDFLSTYLDSPYLWGGESEHGIDCSGLVRRGLINALLNQGLNHGKPACLRRACDLWWNDCTAREIGEGYGGRTVPVLETPSLNHLDYSLIQPGDMAVTKSGIHIMAYWGDRVWIEADPHAEKVIMVPIPSPEIGWCDTPMKIVRWRILDDRGEVGGLPLTHAPGETR